MNPYWKCEALESLYLEDSWVLSIVASPERLEIGLDFVLRESHPEYGPPEPGKQYCYKRGRLIFAPISELHWTDQGLVKPTIENDEIDYGSLDIIEFTDRVWSMTGDFGHISLVSQPPRVEWESQVPR